MKRKRIQESVRLIGLVLLVIASTNAYAQPDDASLPGSAFEIDYDANLAVDGDGRIDWLSPSVRGSTQFDVEFDEFTGSNDNSFGQGSKEDTPVPTPVTGSIPPNKSDLTAFGVYLEDQGLGDRFLHLFWTRVQDPSGTTNMDFEFNQRGLRAGDLSANGVTPIRSYQDMLIQYDLENGGTVPKLYLSFWLDGSGDETAADCEASSKLPCWGKKSDLGGLATGSINTSFISDTDLGLGNLDPRTFGEASIDFGQLLDIVNSNSCLTFGSAYLKSRSSDSFTASMKDFIAPLETQVSNCATIKIIKKDDSPEPKPLQGVEFKLYADSSPFGGTYNFEGEDDGAALDSCTTDASGECEFLQVFPGYYWVVETNPAVGHDEVDPIPVEVTGPGANETVNVTNKRKPASLTINKKDDAGNPLSGATFTLFVDEDEEGDLDASEDTVAGNCTTDSAGSCKIESILPAGYYCLQETTVPTGYTRDTNLPDCFPLSLAQNKVVNYVNPRLPAKVTINKTDDASPPNVLTGAEFTLYSDADAGGTLGDGDTVFGSCTTDTTGSCSIENILPPGAYCLDETEVPAGHSKDNSFPQCFLLALNETKTVSAVNPRKPAKIVISKTDDASPPNPLQDVGFTLYTDVNEDGVLDGGDTPFGTCSTDAEGACSIENILPAGKYCLDETNVPTNYSKDAAFPQCFTLALGDVKSVNAVNPRSRGAIRITKTRKHAAAAEPEADPHSDVTFEVKDGDGTLIGSGTTDSNGVYCVDNLLLSAFAPGDGNYVVTETVPPGYSVDQDNPQTVTVDQEGSCSENPATVSFGNTPLTDFTITVNSQVDGGTSTVIVCDNGAGTITIPAKAPENGDGSLQATNLLPGVYNCKLTIQ